MTPLNVFEPFSFIVPVFETSFVEFELNVIFSRFSSPPFVMAVVKLERVISVKLNI